MEERDYVPAVFYRFLLYPAIAPGVGDTERLQALLIDSALSSLLGPSGLEFLSLSFEVLID